MENKGLFIAIEGCDGSGKSTVIAKVFEMLKAEDLQSGYQGNGQVYLTREPGGSRIAEQIRNIILDRSNTEEDPKTEALLYAASRRQHMVDTVFPLLNKDEIVITDRFIDSSLAYQGYARGLGIDEVCSLSMFAIDGRLPDFVVYFDIDPALGLKRIAIRSKKDRASDRLDQEKLAFHKKVYQGYEEIQKKYPERKFITVDASQELPAVITQVHGILRKAIDDYRMGLKEA
jgi:dTMP kinase